ncbi:MAG: penicillin-binding protein 1C, partial [Alphaproteobacteria bacterium]|nr:penicillin-binding protein 1C [Alphaproteobacteria bacterium]
VFGPYALAVWVGDFRGSSRGQVVGIASAAPLFFDIARAVIARERPEDLLQPKALTLNLSRSVACSDTGDIANPYCPARESVWLIPGVSPVKPTNIYRRLLVNKTTGLLACRFAAGKTEHRVLEFWPSDLTEVFSLAGIRKAPPPAWEPGCAQASARASAPPRIVSPSKASGFRVRDGADNRLPLRAALDGSAHAAFWFVGDTPLGRAAPSETVFWPMTRGKHVIRVVDDAGNADSRLVLVE